MFLSTTRLAQWQQCAPAERSVAGSIPAMGQTFVINTRLFHVWVLEDCMSSLFLIPIEQDSPSLGSEPQPGVFTIRLLPQFTIIVIDSVVHSES